eukprot:12171261-Alexandrium_andersonii.AAC.1
MSASLVGSEMCIRDRGTSAPRSPNGTPSARAAAPSARHCLVSKGVEAVSYTHLTLPTICSV